jgi:hypothetical protein
MKLISIQPSTRKDKKLVALFDLGDEKFKAVHFGAKGYSDFPTHKNEDRKELYLKRHSVNEDWTDPLKPGTLSRYVLWNKPSLDASISDYKRRFRL